MAYDCQLCDFSTEERQKLASHLKTNHVEPVKKKMKKKKVQYDPDKVK